MKSIIKYKKPLVVLLVLLLSLVYFGLLTPKEYVSSSTFVIKEVSEDQPSSAGFSFLEQASTNATTPIVKAFAKSPELFSRLNDRLDFQQHLLGGSSISNALHTFTKNNDYWFKAETMIELKNGESDDVMILDVSSYNALFSQKLNETVMNEIESLVEKINSETKRIKLRNAMAVQAQAEKSLNIATDKLSAYQKTIMTSNPVFDAEMSRGNIAKLEAELIRSEVELSNLSQYLSPRNLEVKQQEMIVNALAKKIEQEKGKIVNVPNDVVFAKLKFDLDMYMQSYQMNTAATEKVKMDSAQDSIVLVSVSSATLPQGHSYPNVLLQVINVLLIFLSISWLVSMIRATTNKKGLK